MPNLIRLMFKKLGELKNITKKQGTMSTTTISTAISQNLYLVRFNYRLRNALKSRGHCSNSAIFDKAMFL